MNVVYVIKHQRNISLLEQLDNNTELMDTISTVHIVIMIFVKNAILKQIVGSRNIDNKIKKGSVNILYLREVKEYGY